MFNLKAQNSVFLSSVVGTLGTMDSDDEELESFEVTDFDLQNEFNPNRFKRKKGGKKQAIYGECPQRHVCQMPEVFQLFGKWEMWHWTFDTISEQKCESPRH